MQYRRLYVVAGVLVLLMIVLLVRLFDLTVLKRSFLMRQGQQRFVRVIKERGNRGMILDRMGHPLAISTMMVAVWVNPQVVQMTPQKLSRLSSIIGSSPEVIKASLKRHAHKSFVYLKRGLPPVVMASLKELQMPGLFVRREYRRFYPQAQVAAQVVGLTNIDDRGQEGLELGMNHWLQGKNGKRVVLKDRLGHVVADVEALSVADAGQDVMLSIDQRIQYICYQALQQTIMQYKALSATVVVLDVPTGEVLAMVNVPSYNPNLRPTVGDPRVRNRAVTDVFEPGSTIKPFSVAAALMSGLYQPDTIIDTQAGGLTVSGRTIRDHQHFGGKMTLTQVLKKSSNVGMSKVALDISAKQMLPLFKAVGFGAPTQRLFPGEVSGRLPNIHRMQLVDLASLSFGYGISVTALQLAAAYAVIANHGAKVPVTLLRREHAVTGRQVIPPKVAHQVLSMLAKVVSAEGTGRRARVPGFRVAGKTGTAEIAGPGGYDRDRHIASFVGMAPLVDPRLVVAVVVREPQGSQYYASQVAAPVFAQIMSHALRLFNVAPDQLQRSTQPWAHLPAPLRLQQAVHHG